MSKQANMPKGFPQNIHAALRAWQTPKINEVLIGLHQAHELRIHQAINNPHLICNQILMNGLERLTQTHADKAQLLKRRFLNQETAHEVSYSLNISEDMVFQRQRTAIRQLSQIIWEQELAQLQQQAQRIEERLEPRSYTRLFGIKEKVSTLRAQVENAEQHWVLTLEGMGGIGKTTLADALLRELAHGEMFREIAWISARQRLFHLTGRIEALPATPILTLEELINRLIEQLNLADLRHQSKPEKRSGLKQYLSSQPCLIVIDNLETMHDSYTLIPQLRDFANPSKFLITTRHSLRGESGVYAMTLNGLSQTDTLALVRYEASTQGLSELAAADDSQLASIYEISEGNPLATKLIVGQAHTFPLQAIIERLHSKESQSAHELLDFIHMQAWQQLNQDCRDVLQALTLMPDVGGEIANIAAATQLNSNTTSTCLQQLARVSLVSVKGGLNAKSYLPHALTRAFVLQQANKPAP